MPAPSGIGLEKKEQKDDEDEKDYKEEKAYEVVLNRGQLDLPSGSRMSAFRAGLASDAVRLPTAKLQVQNTPSNRKPDLVRSGSVCCGQLDLNQHKISPTSTSS